MSWKPHWFLCSCCLPFGCQGLICSSINLSMNLMWKSKKMRRASKIWKTCRINGGPRNGNRRRGMLARSREVGCCWPVPNRQSVDQQEHWQLALTQLGEVNCRLASLVFSLPWQQVNGTVRPCCPVSSGKLIPQKGTESSWSASPEDFRSTNARAWAQEPREG